MGGLSIRRACRLFLVYKSLYHRKWRRFGQADIKHRIMEICQTMRLYGYRCVRVMLFSSCSYKTGQVV